MCFAELNQVQKTDNSINRGKNCHEFTKKLEIPFEKSLYRPLTVSHVNADKVKHNAVYGICTEYFCRKQRMLKYLKIACAPAAGICLANEGNMYRKK